VHIDESTFGAAKGIAASKMRLKDFLDDPVTRDACTAVGVKPMDLMPRPRESFAREVNRPQILPEAIRDRRFEHFEQRRVYKIALVLQERQDRKDGKTEEQVLAMENESALLQAYDAVYQAEMARTAKIDSAARKARNVLVRENDVLMARREKYITKTLSAAEREKRLAMARQMQREAIQEKAKAKQEDIARIQQQKEERQEAHRTAVEEAQQRREARMRDFQEQAEGVGKLEVQARKASGANGGYP
jgi:hypothetical protein